MGRGRAPCCAKVGLNKGSWTPEEDMRLIAYIHKYDHGNWRALPKHAGLLRCGKSCRLRWINYLRPDIKRGNFTQEEEDAIIKLHGSLGNKWSKIASCLPGRTDNEIKNVWNTHLKKRLQPKERKPTASAEEKPEEQASSPSSMITTVSNDPNYLEQKAEETDKIEIPIEPNLDLWDMLQDSSVSEPPQQEMTIEASSSSDMGLIDSDPLVHDLPEINIEPDIWNMLDNDLDVTTENGSTNTSATGDDHQNGDGVNLESQSKWLQYLEKELDLWGERSTSDGTSLTADAMEEGDLVASYFQALQSSPSPLDPIY